MRRNRAWVAVAVAASLLFTRISGAHYVVSLDQIEPTTAVIQKTCVVGDLLGSDTCPAPDSPADINLDISVDSSVAKSAQADVELAALICVFIFLFHDPFSRSIQNPRRPAVRYLGPPRFIRPPLRAPPL